jgi:hypothetical protein
MHSLDLHFEQQGGQAVQGRIRRIKWPLAAASGIVLGALVTTGVAVAFTSRTTDTTRQLVHFSGAMDAAGSKGLYVDTHFKIKGQCIDLGGGVFRAQPMIKTKDDNGAFTSSVGDATDQDWDTADGYKKIQADGIAAQGTSSAPDFAAHTNDSFFGAIKNNGKEVLHGFVWSAAFHGPACRWGGYVERVVES